VVSGEFGMCHMGRQVAPGRREQQPHEPEHRRQPQPDNTGLRMPAEAEEIASARHGDSA
jgi:hypothetical protein